MPKIYTKTGDQGQTSLIGGTRVAKSNIRIEAYGTTDELNSWIGLIADQGLPANASAALKEIQDRLFTIGSFLASDPEKSKMKIPDLVDGDILFLEKEIDQMNESLPELTSFILPGGHVAASYCHIARCVCRRAERSIVELFLSGPSNNLILQYMNRLSDFLFVLGRFCVFHYGAEEIKWMPRK